MLKVATINVCISKMDRELASDMELDSVVFQVSSPDNRLTLAGFISCICASLDHYYSTFAFRPLFGM